MTERQGRGVWAALTFSAAILAVMFAVGVIALWSAPRKAPLAPNAIPTALKAATEQSPLAASPEPGNDFQREIAVLKAQLTAQETQLSAEKDELNRLDELAKLLMTIAGVFTLVLGAASWKALDDQRKAAVEIQSLERQKHETEFKGIIERSKNSLDSVGSLRDELQRDFPMFGRMQNNFHTILLTLKSACARLIPRDDTYNTLEWGEVQHILYYENAIATLLLLNTQDYKKELSEIYRSLGLFYGSRFNASIQDNKSRTSTQRCDLDRARFYFDRAIEMSPYNYHAYLHAGHFTQYYDDQSLATVSREYFQRAAEIGHQYQKPLISIAIIELEAFNNWDRALGALRRANSRNEYDTEIPLPALETISYLDRALYVLEH